jgi:hypothetical protein
MDAGDRLATVVSSWTALVRAGDVGPLEGILAEDVVWQGLLPELVCHGRTEVMGLLSRFGERPPRITRLEAAEAGERVAISVDGPDFPEIDEVRAAGGPRSLVFVFDRGKVVRMESFADREEAFAALG